MCDGEYVRVNVLINVVNNVYCYNYKHITTVYVIIA